MKETINYILVHVPAFDKEGDIFGFFSGTDFVIDKSLKRKKLQTSTIHKIIVHAYIKLHFTYTYTYTHTCTSTCTCTAALERMVPPFHNCNNNHII